MDVAIIWNASGKHDVLVASKGKRLGITKKNWNIVKARSFTCKKERFKRFANIIEKKYPNFVKYV